MSLVEPKEIRMNPSPVQNTAPHESPNPKAQVDPGCNCIGCTIERVAARLGIAVLDIRPAGNAPQGSKVVSVDKLSALAWERMRKSVNAEPDCPKWADVSPEQRYTESRETVHLLAQLALLEALAPNVVIVDEYRGFWKDPQADHAD